MPANRPIVVVFSKDMDPASVELGRTFHVYQIDDQDQIAAEVEGSLTLSGDTLRFMPSNPWQEDTLYRYELTSNGDIGTPTEAQAANPTGPLCDVATTMCSEEGLPLQTQLLSQVSVHDTSSYQPGGGRDNGVAYRPYYWEGDSPALTGGGQIWCSISAVIRQAIRCSNCFVWRIRLMPMQTCSMTVHPM